MDSQDNSVFEEPDSAPGTGRTEPVSLQALRSERTRAALLEAAETVFARDGFEASRIEDIAIEAGRSRGAFYANFESKTEVFLALRTQTMVRRAAEVRAVIREHTGGEEMYRALYRNIVKQLADTRSLLLQIEFKLFALRHPEMLAELSARHLEASMSMHTAELRDLVEGKELNEDLMRRNTLLIESLLEGLALNALFSPEVLTQAWLERVLPPMLATFLAK